MVNQTQLSADGGWWWNGAAWVPATSPDGLWRWDGESWQPALELDAENPRAVVEALDRLVDDRFAHGGQLLALRAHEWRPRTETLSALVAQAAPLAARLAAVDAQLAGMDGHAARPSIRGLLGGGERDQLEAEGRRIDQELRPLVALIGRTAPQPSLKEADEILVPAQRLHERVLELQQALAELERLRAERDGRASGARAELDRVTAERDARLSEPEHRVQEREAEHRQAVADLSGALRLLRIPDPGPPLARFQGLVLHESRIETPDGRGPVEGARGVVGSAAELAAQERELIGELWLLEAANAVAMHDALAAGSSDLFVLVATTRVSTIVPVPDGAEEEARDFVTALQELVRDGALGRRRWEAQVAAAEGALEAALADTSAVDDARAELERARLDPELAAPVKAAERRLREAQRPTPVLAAAEERVGSLVEAVLHAPADLQPAVGR
jgi:hypothetical protein